MHEEPVNRSFDQSNHDNSVAEILFSEGTIATGTFGGFGERETIALLLDKKHNITIYSDKHNKSLVTNHQPKKTAHLSVFESVSIAGCDLLGSCLYTAGVCASNGGKVR